MSRESKKLRILHCIHSLSWGGLEIYTVDLIRKLAQEGIQQVVLCPAQSKVSEELKNTPVELATYSHKKISKLQHASLIRKITREKEITHLHSHTRLDMWACALSRWNSDKPRHIYNLYMNALPKKDFIHRWLFSKVDAICTSSEKVLNDIRMNFPIAPEKTHLLRYGRETEAYLSSPEARASLRDSLGFKEEDLVFGTLCRIDPGKGVRELVLALDYLSDEELKRVHLVVVGDPTILGRDKEGQLIYEEASLELSKWIEGRQRESRLQGHLHKIPFQKDYIPFVDALDVFILASHNETYSLSVLDAMLMKKPVIGTDAGGTTEQVGKNERGYLIEPRNPQSLAEAIRYYLHNPEANSAQGQSARAWVLNQHNWPQTIQQTLALYS